MSRHRQARRGRSTRGRRAVAITATVLALSVIVIVAIQIGPIPRPLAAPPSSTAAEAPNATPIAAARDTYSTEEITVALDALINAVHPSRPENAWFPMFAKARLQWLFEQYAERMLRIILLEDLANTNLEPRVLMASTILEGQKTIIVVQEQFLELLGEGGGAQGLFTDEQRNDMMLALVHEAVHLQKPAFREPATLSADERKAEEVRVWREVNDNVVRQLLADGRPVHSTFVRAAEAFRRCGNRADCELLAPAFIPPATVRRAAQRHIERR